MKSQHLLNDAIHMAVCQSIDLNFIEMDDRGKEVRGMINEALLKAIKRATDKTWRDVFMDIDSYETIKILTESLKKELGL